jgi:nucleotide-binding universal stress UspA family protein
VKKILVPCDFSEQAINAFRFALSMEVESKTEIHLLHVIDLPVLYDTVLMPALSFEQENFQDLKENAEQKCEQIVHKYPADSKVKSKVAFGPVYRMIVEYIAQHEIDLVVMGTRGVTGIREIFIGSNTEKVVRASHVPVIAVKNYVKPGGIKDIVFPNTVVSDSQEDLVMKVKALQHSLHATLHIVWINTPLNFKKDTETREQLERFAKRYMLRDYTINVFNDMEEEAGIINFTHLIDADLIALGTHGRKGIARIINGSIAEDLVNHVDRAVWTYSMKNEA